MSSKPKISVIGAGIMGISTAWALHRHGAEVQVFEQGPVPNPKGSSIDETRLIRYPYGGELGYTRMVADAFAAWDRLFGDLESVAPGEQLYHETGALVLDTAAADGRGSGSQWAVQARECLSKLDIPFQDLTGAQCAELVPNLKPDIVLDAFYQPAGGVLNAGRIVELASHYLMKAGIGIHPHRQVKSVDVERAIVDFGDGTSEGADAVVIAAGPWVGRLLPNLNQRVTPSRQMVVYVDLTTEELATWRDGPMILDIDPENGFYTVPPRTSDRLKIGDHKFTMIGDPDDDREVALEQAENVLHWAGRRINDLGPERLNAAKACFYTVQPEERFLLEPIGGAGFVMSGFSGHGFKFGAVMGETMADLVLGKTARQDADAVARWAAGLAAAA
ncbi:MAG: FAD-dependent oxidoreductase [Alphaproteobacteria bacterium]|nr:FAD-dependent oxidoreductase [Alphaproteobacteria bacterium SS10]